MLDVYDNSFSAFIKKKIDLSMHVCKYVDVSKINEYNSNGMRYMKCGY